MTSRIHATAIIEHGAVIGDDIRVVNTIGLERKGFAPERIRHIKDAIRHLFKAPSALQDALGSLSTEFPGDPDVIEISDFVARSRTGIAKMG